MWPLYYNCIETSDICNFARYCYNNYDNFHVLGILPVYGYMENKVNEWTMSKNIVGFVRNKGFGQTAMSRKIQKFIARWGENQT